MSLLKIVSHIECDECGSCFTAKIPNDASCEGKVTIFEIATDHIDFIDDVPTDKSAGYHDGQFFCPTCWEPKSEKLFIQDIREGRVTEEQLEGLLENYKRYLPSRALQHVGD